MHNEEEKILSEMVQDLSPIESRHHGDIGHYEITPKGVSGVHRLSGKTFGPYGGPKRIAAERVAVEVERHHKDWVKEKTKQTHEEKQVDLYAQMISEQVKRVSLGKNNPKEIEMDDSEAHRQIEQLANHPGGKKALKKHGVPPHKIKDYLKSASPVHKAALLDTMHEMIPKKDQEKLLGPDAQAGTIDRLSRGPLTRKSYEYGDTREVRNYMNKAARSNAENKVAQAERDHKDNAEKNVKFMDNSRKMIAGAIADTKEKERGFLGIRRKSPEMRDRINNALKYARWNRHVAKTTDKGAAYRVKTAKKERDDLEKDINKGFRSKVNKTAFSKD